MCCVGKDFAQCRRNFFCVLLAGGRGGEGGGCGITVVLFTLGDRLTFSQVTNTHSSQLAPGSAVAGTTQMTL